MTEPTTTQDPADIERDIRHTQEEMSRTVDRIGDQLTPRNLLNALLDQAESNNIDARTLLDGARRNPLALAMIAGGAIWLASDSDAKLPKMPSRSPAPDRHSDTHHRDYISHMEQVGMQEGEDPLAYQRRRDIARSNYFMVERRHEEDDTSFRNRLDDAAEAFRKRRHAWSESTRNAGGAAADKSRAALDRTRTLYDGNPLVGGLIAAAAGAFFGSIIPETRMEQRNLAGVGEKARDIAAEQTDKLVSTAREQKDKLVAAAEDKAGPSSDPGQNQPPMGQSQPAVPT